MEKLDAQRRHVRLRDLYKFSMTRQATVDEAGRIFLPADFAVHFPYRDPVLYRHRTQASILVFRQESLSDELLKRLRTMCAQSYSMKLDKGKISLPAEFQVRAFGVNKSPNSKIMLIGQRSFFEMQSRASFDETAKTKIPDDIDCVSKTLENDDEITDVIDSCTDDAGRIRLSKNLLKITGQTDQFLVVQGQRRKAALFLTEDHLPLNDPGQLTALARHSCPVEMNSSFRISLPKDFALSALRIQNKEYADLKIVVYKSRFEIWSPEEWGKHAALPETLLEAI